MNTTNSSLTDPLEDSDNEELDKPIDFKDLPICIDWNAELPANMVVPRVDIHSLVLDFAAVSFLDISGLKGLKTVRESVSTDPNIFLLLPLFPLPPSSPLFLLQLLKELVRVEVEIYIVACDRKCETPVPTSYNTVSSIIFKKSIFSGSSIEETQERRQQKAWYWVKVHLPAKQWH